MPLISKEEEKRIMQDKNNPSSVLKCRPRNPNPRVSGYAGNEVYNRLLILGLRFLKSTAETDERFFFLTIFGKNTILLVLF